MKQRTLTVFIAALAVVVSVAGAQPATAAGYRMVDIGHLGNNVELAANRSVAMNDAGQVCGKAYLPDGTPHAFVYDPVKGFVDINARIGSSESWAEGISPNGVVYGLYLDGAGRQQAFVYEVGADRIA